MRLLTDEDGDISAGKTIFWGVLGAVILVLLLSFMPFSNVSTGHRGVQTIGGRVTDEVLTEGWHTVNPLVSVHEISVQTETIETPESAASKDLQDVTIDVVASYHIPESLVRAVYQQYKGEDTFRNSKLAPTVHEAVKAVSAQYTAEELVTKRSEFSDKVTALVTQKFNDLGANMETLKIANFKFSEQFSHAIEAKATAVQNAEAEKNKLVQVQYQAQQQIESAKAQAETIKIQAQAINSQGGADYVKLKAIEKWNGQLPAQMIPGSAVPFVDLKQ